MIVRDSKKVCAPDFWNPAMSVLYKQRSAQCTGFQIGILRGARSFQLSSGFTKQNFIFEES
jgi:hypothetical protein